MKAARMRSLLAVTFVAVVVAGTAGQQHTPLSDSDIQARVEHRLVEEGLAGLSVTVRERVVTLGGAVASVWARDEAIEQTRKTDDVLRVVSELTIQQAESDEILAEAVVEKVRRYVFFSVFDDVNVEVTGGVATLTGFVTMPYKAQALVKLASRVSGMQSVTDELEVLPVSGSDDAIRYEIAVRIYNDPLFWNYAIQVNPPVHVIVRHGRVTLTGIVISEVERRKAEVIARGVFGVFGVENQLRLEGSNR